MVLQVGDTAPDFTLKDPNLEKVTLSSFKNKKNVLILFFPFANSDDCKKELCTFRDGLSIYNDLDAQILAISVDSHFSLKLWDEKEKFSFPLLSDFNKDVCKAYGAFYDVFVPGIFDYKGVAKRAAFVIDKKGVIQYTEILESALDAPNYNAIKKSLNSLK